MFNFFRKKKLITDFDFEFLKALASELQAYNLLSQINKDFIIGKRKAMPTEKHGSFTYIFNADLEKKYQNKNLPAFFIIKNIQVKNIESNSPTSLELYIMEGIICGYYCDCNIVHLDLTSFDLSNSFEKHFDNKDKQELVKILQNIPQNIMNKLDSQSTFKIDLPEGIFYSIKDFEDGNYLGVDLQGAVYGLIHDPYEVEKLFDNKEVFFEKLESGEFDIEKYYSGKMS